MAPLEDLEDLYENAPCGYLSLSPDGRIVKVNLTLCGWLGKDPSDLVGRHLRELLNVAGGIFYETHFAPLLRMQGFFDEVALDLVTANGDRLPVLANARERRSDEGALLFTRIALFRAAQRRRYERELVDLQAVERDMRRQLEQLNATLEARIEKAVAEQLRERAGGKLREQFIAVLGHDLRNPLAAIGAGHRLLTKQHQDSKSVRILRQMGESIGRMSHLIDDVMDFARGRLGGGIVIERTSGQRIEPVLAQVIDEIRASNPDRVFETRFDLPHPIDVDHARIAQMFSNLVGNAVAHGAVDLPIVVHASLAGGQFELSVANGGAPIPPAVMERLFEPFVRGEVRDNQGGLGLGLYIASQIAQAHGGRLDVTSDPGKTRFTFRMPVDPSAV